MPKQSVKVIKVPLTSEEKLSTMKPQTFPRMPILYLELLENKKKIRPELIGKDYVPKESDGNDFYNVNSNQNEQQVLQPPQTPPLSSNNVITPPTTPPQNEDDE